MIKPTDTAAKLLADAAQTAREVLAEAQKVSFNSTENNTQFALLAKDVSQIQKDLTSMGSDVKSLLSARFVTQNELALAITASETRVDEKSRPFKILGTSVVTAIILGVSAAVLNLIFK